MIRDDMIRDDGVRPGVRDPAEARDEARDEAQLSPLPVAMLPVRIETRYAAGGSILRIRIFPDDCAVDTHEKPLTADERAAALAYRTDASPQRWRDLAARFGAGRSGWLARVPLSGPGDPGTRQAAWTRAPRTRVLPSRWHAFGYKSGQRVFSASGRPVPSELAVGPDPSAGPVAGAGAPVDAGMRWLVEFTAAVDNGMAIEVALPPAARGRLDRVIVLGVRETATTGADDLCELLTAQRYTAGLAFLADGTPTNNTREERAPFDSSATPPQVPPGPPGYVPRDGSNRDLTARALGIDDAALAGLPGADTGGVVNNGRRAMCAALWPATLGYYLEQLLAPAVGVPMVGAIREHFAGWVRGGGPLPVLRIGDQPYGLLAATPLDRWQPRDGDAPAGLVDLIRRGIGIWRDSLADVPRTGKPGTGDPSQNLLATLAVQPHSISYRGRSVLGGEYVSAAWRFLRQQLPGTWWQAETAQGRRLLDSLGLTARPRLTTSTLAADYFPLPSPPVTAQAPTDAAAGLEPNYLAWLSGTNRPGYRGLRDETYADVAALPTPRPLLYLLARHSLLQAYLQAARAMAPPPLSPAGREDELIGIDELDDDLAAPRPATPWDELAQAAKGSRLDQNPAGPVEAVRAALATLSSLPVRTLERLFAETIDVCSYRLDAWATSIALRRLDAVRATQRTGVHLGGWGAVLDVEPDPAPSESRGFIHAPSLAHATAAAILASGYLTHHAENGRHPLAIDLSSARVRLALGLLDGVRQGASPGALLGRRFERDLHERRVDRYLDDFRRFAPLREDVASRGGDQFAARTVVDGLELHRRWVAAGRRNDGTGWPGAPRDRPAIAAALATLDDAVDAVADVLLAESVFQAARGDATRAAAALDAAAAKAQPPADLEVVRTPRSGIAITYRLLALVPGDARPGGEWAADPGEPAPRAVAEPRLAALAARLLPPPHAVTIAVEYGDRATGQVIATRSFRLDEVRPRLGPLDAVYDAEPHDAGQESEIVERIRYHAGRTRPAGVPADALISVAPLEASGGRADDDDVPLPEFLEAARAVRDALAGTRTVTTADLCAPECPSADTTDLDELCKRADTVLELARTTADRLARCAAGPAEAARAALLAAAAFGIAGAVPISASGEAQADRAALAAQADRVLGELRNRLAAGSLGPAAGGIPERRGQATAVLTRILGDGFLVLPLLSPPAQTGPLFLDIALPSSGALTGGDPLAPATWLDRAARVRPAVQRFNDAALYAEALTGADVLHLAVGQLPAKPGDRWIGLPFDAGHGVPAGRLSYVAARPLGTPTRSMAGIVVDEWTEAIPAAETTTAVALHFDRPNAAAPQAIILGVPPRQDCWTLADLEATVTQTLDLAQARMVDPDVLRGAGHLLPAIHLAANLRGSTIATDLKRGKGWRVS